MKQLAITINLPHEGFKNHKEAFHFIHKELPSFNYDTTGIVTAGNKSNVPQASGEQIGKWEVREAATKPEVVIEVGDGVATVSDCPDGIEVRIIDFDMFDQGDHTLTGENAVTEEYRAWLEKNRPEWYAEQLKREGKDAEWK